MTEKKPYSQPQLFRVELNQEQAILSACSLSTTSASVGGNVGCRPNSAGGCKKRDRTRNRDSGARPS
ncbi:MAG: hypothetical protein AAB242_09220 [Nitrospirota bacterium]|mgnify:CR=1 FL=1